MHPNFSAKRIYEDFSYVLKPGTIFIDYITHDPVVILSRALTWQRDYGLPTERDAFRAWVIDQGIA